MSACRSHGNSDLGQWAASRVIELEPENSAGYLLSSSMLTKRRLSDDTARMRWLMRERRLKMVSGYSLVHVEQRTHKFVANLKRLIVRRWSHVSSVCEERFNVLY